MFVVFRSVIRHCFYYDYHLGIETLPFPHEYEKGFFKHLLLVVITALVSVVIKLIF